MIEFLQRDPNAQKMLGDIGHFLDQWLPCYIRDNRSYLTVAIGCTGGRHRSVYLVEALAQRFESQLPVLIRHRGLVVRMKLRWIAAAALLRACHWVRCRRLGAGIEHRQQRALVRSQQDLRRRRHDHLLAAMEFRSASDAARQGPADSAMYRERIDCRTHHAPHLGLSALRREPDA